MTVGELDYLYLTGLYRAAALISGAGGAKMRPSKGTSSLFDALLDHRRHGFDSPLVDGLRHAVRSFSMLARLHARSGPLRTRRLFLAQIRTKTVALCERGVAEFIFLVPKRLGLSWGSRVSVLVVGGMQNSDRGGFKLNVGLL